MKIIKLILKFALLAFIVMQFIRPDKNEAGYESVAIFEKETIPTPEVVSILKTNCYDCHSNQTQYPWYAEIAPINYWLDDHVEEGKEHFNVSNWDSYSVKKKDHKLDELIEEVEEGHMPLDSYTWMHGSLSEENKNTLIQWATMARIPYQKELKNTQ